MTDENGTVTERYAYDAYGVPTVFDGAGNELPGGSAENNRYMYTGREWDSDLALYHYRTRPYDPYTGRFPCRDPIGYVDGWNQYQYVGSQPLTGLDPLGLATLRASRSGPSQQGGIKIKPKSSGGFLCSVGKITQNPDWDVEVDGCSVPIVEFPLGTIYEEWNFYPACARHDGCYQTCGSDRKSCDDQMFRDMMSECMRAGDIYGLWAEIRCRWMAQAYYSALRLGGWQSWSHRQNQTCSEEWRPCYYDCNGDIVIK